MSVATQPAEVWTRTATDTVDENGVAGVKVLAALSFTEDPPTINV